MKISDYSVTMQSRSAYAASSAETFSASIWGKMGSMCVNSSSDEGPSLEKNNTPDEQSLKDLYNSQVHKSGFATERVNSLSKVIDQLRTRMVDHFFTWFFGGEYRSVSLKDLLADSSGSSSDGGQNQEFGGEYFYSNIRSEAEETSFSTTGTVINSEGKEINFNMNFTMSRSFTSSVMKSASFGARMLDPLVINLDSNIADISDQSFYFDLDCDGKEENITNLGKGSAFLALDKNGDGIINDGSELFGAQSGDGFADLAEYDKDRNGWIDENDSVFEHLKIFSVGKDGEKTLLTLKEAGIGAICLSNADTDYHVTKDIADNASAYIRKTGIFLYENGSVGSVQQVDLATTA